MKLRNYIRNYCMKIAKTEGLNNLHSIQFRACLPDGNWGKNCDGSPNNTRSIVFSTDILDIRKFEKKEKYHVWLIILHEIAHLKIHSHNKNFHNCLKNLANKYPSKDFYIPLIKNKTQTQFHLKNLEFSNNKILINTEQ